MDLQTLLLNASSLLEVGFPFLWQLRGSWPMKVTKKTTNSTWWWRKIFWCQWHTTSRAQSMLCWYFLVLRDAQQFQSPPLYQLVSLHVNQNLQHLYHYFPSNHKEYSHSSQPFLLLIILKLFWADSVYSRITLAKLSTHYSLNYANIIGTSLLCSLATLNGILTTNPYFDSIRPFNKLNSCNTTEESESN